jgi:hypothetical protein
MLHQRVWMKQSPLRRMVPGKLGFFRPVITLALAQDFEQNFSAEITCKKRGPTRFPSGEEQCV